MNVVKALGSISDSVTKRLVHSLGKSDRDDLFAKQMGVVRSAQLEAIISTSRPMMMANLANALALILIELKAGGLAPLTILWALAVSTFAILGWRRASLYARTAKRPEAGIRAPGRITLSSLVLALLWCYPIVFVLPTGSPIEIAFVSALTAGMVAGGALALYPVPLAGLIYAGILSATAFCVIVLSNVLPALPFAIVIAAFAYVVLHSVLRHAGMFLSELVERIQAQRQSDITNLLMHAYQGEGGHYLWRCDATMRMATDPAPLRRMLQIPDTASSGANLVELLNAAGAKAAPEGAAAPLAGHLQDLMAAQKHFDVTLTLDDDRTVEFVGRPEAKTGTSSKGFHGYIKDVTQETRSAEKIKRLASIDALTGLLNDREFRIQASTRFLEGCPEGCFFAFLFLDADDLKSVNDNFGHAVGDQLIKEIAFRLTEHLPKDSLIARKGGDEFVALVRCAGVSSLQDWADRLLGQICGATSRTGPRIAVSCCIGVSDSRGLTSGLPELELQADRALYQAKSDGKRQIRLYDEKIGEKLQRARLLESDFKYALDDAELYLDLQAIFDATTLEVVGTEALLRWEHPVFGSVPPEEIVSFARSESLNIKLLEYVLVAAIHEFRKLPTAGFLSVNVNPADLNCFAISDRILQILQASDFHPPQLWLEITESEVLRNSSEAQTNLSKLRAAGIKIAIDDFGAGYSSLGRLGTTPADILKIDRALVSNCDKQPGHQVILNSLNTLAKVHGLSLVAEGVETERELETLRACEVEMLQGFALARPMSADLIATSVSSATQKLRSGSPIEVAI